MKKNFARNISILLMVPFACMCAKEKANDNPDSGQFTMKAIVDVTRVDFAQGGGILTLSWAEGDALKVISDTGDSDVYTIKSPFTEHEATFEGSKVVEGNTFDVFYPAKYETVEGLKARSYTGQVQTGNRNLGHLEFNALASDLDSYYIVNFGAPGVKCNGVLKMVVTLPDTVKVVSSISLSAPEAIFYTKNETDEKTDTLSLSLEDCTIGDDHILTAYMMTSWQDVTIAAGTKLTIDVKVPDKKCHYSRTFSNSNSINLNGGACLNIDISDATVLKHVLAGSGTEADPYQLWDAEDMLAMNGLLAEGKTTYFKMMDNIYMNGINWVGGNQGNSNNEYNQHIDFDGDGHKIINLKCENTGKYTGLVGVLSGRVANVTFENPSVTTNRHAGIVCSYAGTSGTNPAIVENVTITGAEVTQNGNAHTGLVFGHSNVANCEFTDITAQGTLYQNNIGDAGLIGGAQNIAATFTRCHTSGTLTIKSELTPADSTMIPAGGIQGYSVASTYNDCTFCGTINGGANCGGIVGYTPESKAGAKIRNCTVLEGSKIIATKHGDHCLAEKVGGIIGYSYAAEVSECTNYAEIKGSKSVGGIVGQQGASGKQYDYIVKDCKNYGEINGDDNAIQFFGGIIGLAWNKETTLQDCENHGEVKASNATCVGGVTGYIQTGTVENCHNYVAVTGKGTQGGIVGQVEQAVDISDCTNSGTISATGNYAGGIVGNQKAGNISKCSSEGGLVSVGYVGGIAGHFKGTEVSGCTVQTNDGSKITNTSGNNVGGIIGWNETGSVTGCSVNMDITATSSNYVGGIVGNFYADSISDCNYSGILNANQYAGGIAGSAGKTASPVTTTITKCHSNGSITSSTGNVGGICGIIEVGESGKPSEIKHCYSTADITGNGNNAGGIIGNLKAGKISGCWYYGTLTVKDNSGGIAGTQGQSKGSTDVIIENCYTRGTITNSSSQKAGGIAGECYQNSKIRNCYSTMSISGGGRVFGNIAGRFNNGQWSGNNTTDYNMEVTNCIAAGSINSTATSTSLGSSGAVLGSAPCKVAHYTNCWRIYGFSFQCAYAAGATLVDQGYTVTSYTVGTWEGKAGGSTNWWPYHASEATASALTTAYSGWTTAKTDAQITVSDIAAATNHSDSNAWKSDIWDLSGDYPTLKNNPEPVD